MTERLSWNRGCFVETQCFHNVIVSAVTKMLGGVTMPWVSLSLIWACVSARKCYTLSVPTRGYLAEQGSHVVVYTQQRVEGCVVGTFGLINVTGWPLYENRAPVRLQFCVEPHHGCYDCQHPWLWDCLWLERAGWTNSSVRPTSWWSWALPLLLLAGPPYLLATVTSHMPDEE